VYKGLDMKGFDAFEAVISSPAGNTDIILADNNSGGIIGTCSTAGTGGLTIFTPVYCEVEPRNGLLDLRICFTKHTSLKTFRFYYSKKQ